MSRPANIPGTSYARARLGRVRRRADTLLETVASNRDDLINEYAALHQASVDLGPRSDAAAAADLRALQSDLAFLLVDQLGVPVRTLADTVGVSHQRMHQIVAASAYSDRVPKQRLPRRIENR